MCRALNLVLLVFVIVAGLFVGGCGNDTKQFTLTIHVQGEGSVDPKEGEHSFDPKAVVDLTATPSIGWSFKEWIGEVTDRGDATTTVLMEGDKEIIAVFEIPTVDGPPFCRTNLPYCLWHKLQYATSPSIHFSYRPR